MEQFVGVCVAGPWAGKSLAHTSKIKELFRYVGEEADPVTGEYRLNDYNQWHWWPSKEWKAAEVLFGPAVSAES